VPQPTPPGAALGDQHGFDVVGIRYDNDRHSNLVIFEKELANGDNP